MKEDRIGAFEASLKDGGIGERTFSRHGGRGAEWNGSNHASLFWLKEEVCAEELVDAGFPQAILWNNDPKKKIAVDVFLAATLHRAHNDFAIETLSSFFGKERILSALRKYKDRLGDKLVQRVKTYLKKAAG